MKTSKPDYADQILELVGTMRECAKTMCSHYENNQFEEFYLLHSTLCGATASIKAIISASEFFNEAQMKKITCTLTNIAFTLEVIKKYSLARSRRTFYCTKYQLLPLLQDFYIIFHYYTCIANFPEAQEEYYAKTLPEIGSNEFINESLKTNEFPFELSIVVTGYNKVEYTKQCINSILETVPKDLNYELITINHGSSDETQSYFESLGNDKILNLKQNGCNSFCMNLMLEGRYVLCVSNDVVLGENSIENMLKTIKSDPKIYYVVPSTPNISNMQTIPAAYQSIEDFKKFASENNVYDENRHEERTRLCNPVAMIPCQLYSKEMPGIIDTYFDNQSFPDDTNALHLRRNGYKMVLAKDAYCHHFGSVTINDSKSQPLPDYTEGRIHFAKHFGCDPWGFGCCFIPQVMEMINPTASNDISVLGVNMGFGADTLQIKNLIKEKFSGTVATTIYNTTNKIENFKDLRSPTISDNFCTYNTNNELLDIFPKAKFEYILANDIINETFNEEFLKKFKDKLTDTGKMVIYINIDDISVEVSQLLAEWESFSFVFTEEYICFLFDNNIK